MPHIAFQEVIARGLRVTGNTYPLREKLKALGCVWGAREKCWFAPTPEAQQSAMEAVRSQAPLNSPPPPDLGPVDIPAECARHGRTPVDGAVETPFCRSSRKGEKSTVGDLFWGRTRAGRGRFLIVRETQPYYVSRNDLEDMDRFSEKPGWKRSVIAVPVVPTQQEIDEDPHGEKQRALKALRDKPFTNALALLRRLETCADAPSQCDVGRPPECSGPGAVCITVTSHRKGSMAATNHGSLYAVGDRAWFFHPGTYDDYRTVLRTFESPEVASEIRAVAQGLFAARCPSGAFVADKTEYEFRVTGVTVSDTDRQPSAQAAVIADVPQR